jgi:hypothetical protein
MTLKEALESKADKIKLPYMVYWLHRPLALSDIGFKNTLGGYHNLTLEESISNEWEVYQEDEKGISITERQLEDVIKQSLIKLGSSSSNFIEHIKKELGF